MLLKETCRLLRVVPLRDVSAVLLDGSAGFKIDRPGTPDGGSSTPTFTATREVSSFASSWARTWVLLAGVLLLRDIFAKVCAIGKSSKDDMVTTGVTMVGVAIRDNVHCTAFSIDNLLLPCGSKGRAAGDDTTY